MCVRAFVDACGCEGSMTSQVGTDGAGLVVVVVGTPDKLPPHASPRLPAYSCTHGASLPSYIPFYHCSKG